MALPPDLISPSLPIPLPSQVLTLVSNERVPLSDAMRMVFEINSLKNATPATVSRAGILFINESDVGWRPLVMSWVQARADQLEKTYLPQLFDKYVTGLVEMTRKGYKEVTPIRLINKVRQGQEKTIGNWDSYVHNYLQILYT